MRWFPIFEGFWTSSIADENPETRLTFLRLLCMADYRSKPPGMVKATVGAISRAVNLPLQAVENALERLQQPEATSKPEEPEEGRRIIRKGPAEWWVVKYETYAKELQKERRRAYKTRWEADKRAQEQGDDAVHSSPQTEQSPEKWTGLDTKKERKNVESARARSASEGAPATRSDDDEDDADLELQEERRKFVKDLVGDSEKRAKAKRHKWEKPVPPAPPPEPPPKPPPVPLDEQEAPLD